MTSEQEGVLRDAEERIFFEIEHVTRFLASATGQEALVGIRRLHSLLQCLNELQKGKTP